MVQAVPLTLSWKTPASPSKSRGNYKLAGNSQALVELCTRYVFAADAFASLQTEFREQNESVPGNPLLMKFQIQFVERTCTAQQVDIGCPNICAAASNIIRLCVEADIKAVQTHLLIKMPADWGGKLLVRLGP